MKYLGIDYGTKRIGIAISDEGGEFAFPKEIIPSDGSGVEKIRKYIQEEHIAVIVIGHSLASNERENEAAETAEKFKTRLEKELSVPIYMEREDFSTVEAHRYQTTAGHRDDSAAAIILQRFLDKVKK